MDISEIIGWILRLLGALLLILLIPLWIFWAFKARQGKFEKKDDSELGLKWLNGKELYTKYFNRQRFYYYLEGKRQRDFLHGEYNGYDICIIERYPGPIVKWHYKDYSRSAAALIKSSSFHFPKFLIHQKFRSLFTGEFFVKGNTNAQMLFARPDILNFFKQTRRFNAQGNGNEFIFFDNDWDSGNYTKHIKNAFYVLKLLSNVEIPSRFSEHEIDKEKYKNAYKRELLFMVFVVIVSLVIALLINS